MATVGGIDPSFTGQATGSEPPYVRLPDPQRIFARRASRFSVIADGSAIADYLTFLADLSAAQDKIAAATPSPRLPEGIAVAIANQMPPLSRDLAAEADAGSVLDTLLADLAARNLAEGPRAVVASLAARDAEDRQRMIQAVADGLFEIERLAESAIVAAALQVWYALHAAQLDVPSLRNLGETICPCCGGAPSSSTVVEWPDAQGNRYLACSLCCAMWNHIRVKCTACGATKGVSYRSVEGSTGDIAAEVCDTCQGYAKHMVQAKNGLLDPVADDVASYGLDMMLREDGWRRTGLNPFLILT
jgi:FdhE protein